MTEQERKELKEVRELRESLYDQIRWERDVAIKQLEDIGLGLGEKTDKVKEALEKQDAKKVGEWNGQASCPNCQKLFGNITTIKRLVYWEMTHCNSCGQKLDWSEIRLGLLNERSRT